MGSSINEGAYEIHCFAETSDCLVWMDLSHHCSCIALMSLLLDTKRIIWQTASLVSLYWQVEVRQVEAGRNEGNLLYLLHVYCDSLSRLLEKHGFQGFGKYAC